MLFDLSCFSIVFVAGLSDSDSDICAVFDAVYRRCAESVDNAGCAEEHGVEQDRWVILFINNMNGNLVVLW